LASAGKRAAFALFYGPLHYLLVRAIVEALPGGLRVESQLVDLGCGSGASGAAWAGACTPAPRLIGVDRHPWALHEARRTYVDFGLSARLVRSDVVTAHFSKARSTFLAAFVVNELPPTGRDTLLRRVTDRAAAGDRVLIVEPLAGFVAPWWTAWRDVFERAGGRADEWRIRPKLPPIVARLDRAAGLDHTELTSRSLWLGG
jgi:trans-aconitate methyltransferase